MKITRIIAILILIVSVPVFTYAASSISFSEGSRYTYQPKGNVIKGKISHANRQYVCLYNSKGKLISYAKTDSVGVFSLVAPALNKGDNYFYVKSLAKGWAEASKLYKVNLNYSTLKVWLQSYVFREPGVKANIGATGSGIKYSSSNPKVVTVNGSGVMTAKKAGSATITVSSGGVSKKVYVVVPKIKSRFDALKPWYDAQKAQREASWNSVYDWWPNSGPTINTSKSKGTCITYPSVSAQRAGLIKQGQYITGSDGSGGDLTYAARRAVKSINPRYWTLIVHPNKKTSKLVSQGKILPGDILGGPQHTYIYGGKSGSGTLLYNHAGRVVKYSGPGSNRAVWMQPNAFCSNQTVWVIARVNTFMVKTAGANCAITATNQYMAGQTVTVKVTPNRGKKIKSMYVDGKKVSPRTKVTFKKLDRTHGVSVVCN